MKQLVLLLYGVSAGAFNARSCGVCGSSGGGQFFGSLLGVNSNFIGAQFQYYGIKRDQPALFENWPDEHSNNHYNTLQVLGRYGISKRIQLLAFVPYKYNVLYNDTARYSVSGIGDVLLLANIVTLNKRSGAWQHQLWTGTGIKLPSGRYIGSTEMDKRGLPNLQPGTGSYDFIVNTNYTVRNGVYGMNADGGYTITTANSSSYKYGNKLNASVIFFHSMKVGNINILPHTGARYEYTQPDYNNYGRNWLNEQSGGHVAFATIGMQAQYKKIGSKVNYYIPFSQYYGSGYIIAKQQFDMTLFILL